MRKPCLVQFARAADRDHRRPAVWSLAGHIPTAKPAIAEPGQIDAVGVGLVFRERAVHDLQQVLLALDDQQQLGEVELATAEVELAQANLAHLVNGAHPQERAEVAAMYRAKQGELDIQLCSYVLLQLQFPRK